MLLMILLASVLKRHTTNSLESKLNPKIRESETNCSDMSAKHICWLEERMDSG
jgi:hypothetical protein